jgi:hypothetical protein
MKVFVSALALGFVLAFSAPAFAGSNVSAYVGDMLTDKTAAAPAPADKATKKAMKREARREAKKHGGAS